MRGDMRGDMETESEAAYYRVLLTRVNVVTAKADVKHAGKMLTVVELCPL